MTGFALYRLQCGLRRRLLFVLSGLIFPVSVWPLFMSIGVFFVIGDWVACFTLAWRNPPLRVNELSVAG